MNRSQSSLIAIRLIARKVINSRLIYVLLIDTALTFILFTSIFHSHLTSLTHFQSIVQLCSTLPPSPSSSPSATLCSSSRLALREVPTVLQRFLLVTREILSDESITGDGFETMRFKRNMRVGLFVLAKIVIVTGIFTWMSSTRSTAQEGGISLVTEEEEKDTKLGITILPTSNCSTPPPFATSTLPRPRTLPQSPLALLVSEEEEEQEDLEAEEDLPWIFLAISLILHLSIVLFDRGALDPVGQGIVELMVVVRENGNWRWAVVGGLNLLIVGLVRWVHAKVVERRSEKLRGGGEKAGEKEKSESFVVTL